MKFTVLLLHLINVSYLHKKKKKENINSCASKSLKLCCPFQVYFPKVNAVLHDWQTDLCGLYPGTKYLVRVRAQDLRATNHWSSWSGFAQATTAEAGEEQIEGDTEIKQGVCL